MNWVFPLLLGLTAALLVGICYVIVKNAVDFHRDCERAGGRVVDVRDTEVCVDGENRVVLT